MRFPTTFDDALLQVATDSAKLLLRKHQDYGPKNILNSPFGPEHGLIVRLYDKVARLANLIGERDFGVGEINFESLEDTWMDIANYGLIGLMVSRGSFGLPLVGRFTSEPEPAPVPFYESEMLSESEIDALLDEEEDIPSGTFGDQLDADLFEDFEECRQAVQQEVVADYLIENPEMVDLLAISVVAKLLDRYMAPTPDMGAGRPVPPTYIGVDYQA